MVVNQPQENQHDGSCGRTGASLTRLMIGAPKGGGNLQPGMGTENGGKLRVRNRRGGEAGRVNARHLPTEITGGPHRFMFLQPGVGEYRMRLLLAGGEDTSDNADAEGEWQELNAHSENPERVEVKHTNRKDACLVT